MINYDYPFLYPRQVEEENPKELRLAEEWAWDYETQSFKFEKGKFYKVYKNEAIKIWLWKLFQTQRFLYKVYNGDYGEELTTLIGRGYTQGLVYSEAKRFVEEAIYYNLHDYVEKITNFKVEFDNGNLIVSFTAITPYGSTNYKGVI